MGLAVARRGLGDLGGAMEAVRAALDHHVPDSGLASVADTMAREFGFPGWCAITVDGVLDVRFTGGGPRVELEIDGRFRRPLTGGTFRLPSDWWCGAQMLSITDAGAHLLGSPIRGAAFRRIEGCVSSRAGGIEGWVWHPADPRIEPSVTIVAASGQRLTLAAREESPTEAPATLLTRPRGFALAPERLSGMTGPFQVFGGDDQSLLGSPLDPTAEQREAVAATTALRAALTTQAAADHRAFQGLTAVIPADVRGPSPPIGLDRRRRPVDVVMPVHGGGEITRRGLDAVLASVARPNRVIIVDDATEDHALADHLAALARGRRIRLIRNDRNLGYPASANAGIRAAEGRDVVLLNSDTLVPPNWLERLREAAYSAPDIGTVTPLSNNATIVSYPRPEGGNPMPDASETAHLSNLAHGANADAVIDIPVAVGFCMYVRRDCLDAVGPLREDVFAQGYGEENDFCLRARHLGWRHVAAAGVFVAHRGGESFGGAGDALMRRNQAVLERLHPGHAALIVDHARRDPLAAARRRLDLARWRERGRPRRGATLLVAHDDGGGVEQCLAASCADLAISGVRPIVLRPATCANGAMAVEIADGVAHGFPNLRFAIPSELTALTKVLRGAGIREIILHHLLGHHPAVLDLVAQLNLPFDVHVHDYALLCPRVTLVGRDRRYCGEPAISGCEACLADLGSYADEAISVTALRQRSARLLAAARRIIAPSSDTAERIRRYFPGIAPEVIPHDNDEIIRTKPPTAAGRRGTARICVVGAIGVDKGYDVLLACARDAAERGLSLEFVVVGHTIDDGRLLDTGRVFITGEYQPGEAVSLIRAQNATLGWVPSVWPESWCFTLSEAWRAGLRVVAFDLGAQAERIRRRGDGSLLPLGLPPTSINSALLAAAGLPGH